MMQPVDFERRVHNLESRASKLWNEIQRTWPRVNQYVEDQGVWYGGYPYGFNGDFPTTSTTTTTTTTPPPCLCSPAYDYEVTLSGLGNGTCGDCTTFNGTWTLTYWLQTPPICYWRTSVGTVCGQTAYLILQMNASTGEAMVLLTHGTSTIAQYVIGTFDCTSLNTLGYSSSSGTTECSFYPSTLTVQKL